MKQLLLAAALILVQDPVWHCPVCKKDVPATEVKVMSCKEPHGDIIHVKACTVERHVVCRAEVQRQGPKPLKAEACGQLDMNAAASYFAHEGDAMTRFEAVRDGKAAPELKADADLFAVVILGPSGNGADPLRAAKVRFSWDADARTVHAVITRVEWEDPPQVGTADFTVVGFRANIGRVAAGDVTFVVWEETAKSAAPNAPVKETTKPKKTSEQTAQVK